MTTEELFNCFKRNQNQDNLNALKAKGVSEVQFLGENKRYPIEECELPLDNPILLYEKDCGGQLKPVAILAHSKFAPTLEQILNDPLLD